MIVRTAWYSLLAVCALVMVGLQLDRQSAVSPHLAGLVPKPFRSAAQARVTAAMIAQGDPQVALAEAERLVIRRPIPAQSLRLLAVAQAGAGEMEDGIFSIQIAAQRGWRDVAAQEAMARLALSAGDGPEAARRYTALFIRRKASDDTVREIGKQLFALPGNEARDTLARIVAHSERWNTAFLRRGSQLMPPRDFADIVIRTNELGVTYDCGMLETTIGRVRREDAQAGTSLQEMVERSCR